MAVEGNNTVTSDLYPSQTAISLYYTNTRSQGPGQITGSATQATMVVTRLTGTSVSSSPTSSIQSSATTRSSAGGAVQTGAWLGGLGMAVGGVAMAVL